jgi:hypothetical protein
VEFDSLHGANIAITELCGIAPDAPIGGCDPPQPTRIAMAATMPKV